MPTSWPVAGAGGNSRRVTNTAPGGTLGALTEAGGAVFVSNSNGMLRTLDARTGRTLWTTRPGATLGGGPAVADGLVLTGYGVQLGPPARAFRPAPGRPRRSRHLRATT